MSSLCRVALVAFAVGGAISWANTEQDEALLAEEDSCAAGDEACSLSFRQLRGELKSAVLEHGKAKGDDDDGDDDADDDDDDDDMDTKIEKAKKSAEKLNEIRQILQGEADKLQAPVKVGRQILQGEADTLQAPVKVAKHNDDDEDEDDDDDDDDKEDDTDEEPVYGEFCCQFGQGKGAANLKDVGASCYPSAKPEQYDFCDDKSECHSSCNGTWVVGFCALNNTPSVKGVCDLKLNGYGTGYNYVAKNTPRAVMNDTCAESESACGGCNGTWCHYVKTAIY